MSIYIVTENLSASCNSPSHMCTLLGVWDGGNYYDDGGDDGDDDDDDDDDDVDKTHDYD